MLEIELPNYLFSRIYKKYLSVQNDLIQRGKTEFYFFDKDSIRWLEDFINIDLFYTGNFFKHSWSFYPHVDLYSKNIKTNLVIPLVRNYEEQKLILFDQVYSPEFEEPGYWFAGNHEPEVKSGKYSTVNFKMLHGRPCDFDVQGLTNKKIDKQLYQHLDYEEDFYFGLSGIAWDWKPGKALAFPANRIHSTGKMNGHEKIGFSLWFEGSYEEITYSRW